MEELKANLEYWQEQETAAQTALEYTRNQIHLIRCAIGDMVVAEMEIL